MPRTPQRFSASQSFNDLEVAWLGALKRALHAGGDVRQLLRAPASANVWRKVQAMETRIAELKAKGVSR